VLEPVYLEPEADGPLRDLIAKGLVAPPKAKLTDELFRQAKLVKDPAGSLLKALLDERGGR
jgi:hypothetical protein